MKTYLGCIPCFFKQTIEAGKMMGLPDDKVKRMLDKVALQIPEIELASSPPAMGRIIHRIIREQINNPDPYLELKQKSNEIALAIFPDLKKMVENSEDRLLKAVEIAIAGNIIDYGAVVDLDINKEINSIVNSEEDKIRNESTRHFAFLEFKNSLAKANTLLYLADNAGEIVFDRVLIEEIKNLYPDLQIYCAVRGNPVLNDCLIADAVSVGIDKITTVISNGTDAPGTILDSCSKEFLDIWNASDLIISKGQGNYESLSNQQGNIFFMFIAKCEVLAGDIGCCLRDVILCRNR
ncbi:MAG: DUF89 family protein [Spirochaetales bacterium]|nr:DUF89 family protein [Spirochaetales bacterium]